MLLVNRISYRTFETILSLKTNIVLKNGCCSNLSMTNMQIFSKVIFFLHFFSPKMKYKLIYYPTFVNKRTRKNKQHHFTFAKTIELFVQTFLIVQLYFCTFMSYAKSFFSNYTVAVSSWSIANNFVIDFYHRCLEILCQIAQSSLANYFRSYSLLQFGIKSLGIYNRSL